MAIIRVEKTKDFTVMSNHHLRDKRLTLKSKGLLSIMFSLPEDWDYSIAGLVALSEDGITTVRNSLTELEKTGYLIRRALREKGKIIDWEYVVYEKPHEEKPVVEKPVVEKPHVEKPVVEKQTQLNTKEQNTKELSTKEIKDNAAALPSDDTTHEKTDFANDSTKETKRKQEVRHKYGEYKNVLLSDTDLEKLKTEFPLDWEDRIERLSSYMESKGAKYKNHLATIRNWARKDKKEKTSFTYNDYCSEGDSL